MGVKMANTLSTRSLLSLAPALALGAACGAPHGPPPAAPAPIAAPSVIATPSPPPALAETSPRSGATPATVEAPGSFGTFASTGGLLGAWEASAAYCQVSVIAAGGRTSSGVMFTRQLGDFQSPALTAVVRSKGSSGVVVEVGRPSRQVVIKAKQCARFEVRVPGGAGGVGADVEIDCDAGEGARVRASLHAASCH